MINRYDPHAQPSDQERQRPQDYERQPQYASQVHGAGRPGLVPEEYGAGPEQFVSAEAGLARKRGLFERLARVPQRASGQSQPDDDVTTAPVAPKAAMVPEAALGDMAPAPEAKRRGKRYWVGWTAGMVAIGVVVGGVLVGLLRFVNGPVVAGALPDVLEAARASTEPKPDTNMLSGKWIELAYPAVFDTVSNRSTDAGGDQYYISSKEGASRGLVVTTFGLASGRMEDDSSYKYRSIHPDLYKPSEVKVGSEKAVVMTKTDNTEATLFLVHKGRILNIALTSTDPHDNVPTIMQAMAATVRWKQ